MSTEIFYFSGTGNSLRVAQEIAERIGDTKVIPMGAALEYNLSNPPERVGIVSPVIMFGIPSIVLMFIRRLEASNKDTYFFAVTTYGGILGGSLLQVRNMLKARGLELSAGFSILVNRREEWNEVMKKNLDEIVYSIKNKNTCKIDRGPVKDCILKTWIGNKLASLLIPGLDKQFRANERCTGCGICKDVCPVNNIVITDNKPRWNHRCQQCFACFNWCPNKAIRYGKKPDDRFRYTNPEISLDCILAYKKGGQ